MHLVTFPHSPYVGQIFYHPESERTFEFVEKVEGQNEYCTWLDITEKDLVPWGMIASLPLVSIAAPL